MLLSPLQTRSLPSKAMICHSMQHHNGMIALETVMECLKRANCRNENQAPQQERKHP